MIDGPWFITRAALEDFARVAGGDRDALQAEISRAHYVKLRDDGAEVWRGAKPLRLRFLLRTGAGVGGDAPQLVRVEADNDDRSLARLQAQRARSRTVRLWDGSALRQLVVTDEVLDPGPTRRVAYRLTSGQWISGVRGRTRPDEVRELGPPRKLVPDWVRELRGQRPRRGRDR